MSNELKISRELADRLASPHSYVRNRAMYELRTILATPAVDRQAESVYQYRVHWNDIWHDISKSEFEQKSLNHHSCTYITRELYTSLPAPVAVALPTINDFADTVENIWGFGPDQLCLLNGEDLKQMWLGCLDKVKEMNK